MFVLNKEEMEDLMENSSDTGIVFAEYNGDVSSEIYVTNSNICASAVVPYEGEVYKDWCIKECENNQHFVVFDNNDILQIIQTLTSGLKIKLKYDL